MEEKDVRHTALVKIVKKRNGFKAEDKKKAVVITEI